jgi:hypothetical protein
LDNIAKTIPILIEKKLKKSLYQLVFYIRYSIISKDVGWWYIRQNSAFAGVRSGKSLPHLRTHKDGYSIIYIDTEQAVDLEDFKVWNRLFIWNIQLKIKSINMGTCWLMS